ncbi:unnamed protein product, partial [Sphacelaria rigidula]
MEGWEQMVKNTASEVIGRKLIVCNRAVKRWDDEVKEAIRVRREAHARWISSKTTTGWEEHTEARKEVKRMVHLRKKEVWEDVVKETNEVL